MRARILVFPVHGRNWCFARSAAAAAATSTAAGPDSALPNPTLRDLWDKLDFRRRSLPDNAEIAVDFASDKMNRAWVNLSMAPSGSVKNKIYGLGLKLLSRVKPSESFLKSISKDVTEVEVIHPTSLNPRLVRRRVRHIALRGSVVHKKYFYWSLVILPFTTVLSLFERVKKLSRQLTVLPLPNVPFFWISFRAYSHWLALKGSERLFNLISDNLESQRIVDVSEMSSSATPAKEDAFSDKAHLWVLSSKKLDDAIHGGGKEEGLSDSVLSEICEIYGLSKIEVLKYRQFQ